MKKNQKRLLIGGVVVVIILIFLAFIRDNKPKEEYSTTKAVMGPLKQTVSETGTIKPVTELALTFLNPGRLDEVYVQVGAEVTAGTPLASLDRASLELRKLEAEAGLKIAEANLSKIIAGASGETIAVSQSEILQAQVNENAARVDLEKVKKSVAENISQAEKSLQDLESSAFGTMTAPEQAVITAQTALDNAKATGQKSVDNSRSTVLLVLGDRVLTGKIALDNLNTILEDDNAKNLLGVKNSATLTNTKTSRLLALEMLTSTEAAVNKAKQSQTTYDIEKAGESVRLFLYQTSQALSNGYALLEATITSASFSQAQLDAYKNLVSTQSTQVSAAATAVENSVQAFNSAQLNYITSVAAAEENLRQAQVALDSAILTARNNLSNLRISGDQQIAAAQARLDSAIRNVSLAQARLRSVAAPARSQDLSLAEAQISQAQASLANIEKQLADSILLAPLDGVITQVNYQPGEQFGSSGQPMIRMLADGNFEIEVDISESDINKIKTGNIATVTLDALSEDTIFSARVNFIEPAQTLIQGVVYYKVKLQFFDLLELQENLTNSGLGLKAGMTANVVIITDSRENVLQIPARAVIEQDGKRIVRVLWGGQVNEMPVTLGLRGDEGLIEVVSGLNEGDEVVTFVRSLSR